MNALVEITLSDGTKVSAKLPESILAVLDAYLKDNPQYGNLAEWIYQTCMAKFQADILPNYAAAAPSVEATAKALEAARQKHLETVQSLVDEIVVEGGN